MFRTNHEQGLITIANPSSSISESYKELRTNIKYASIEDIRFKTIMVISSQPGEGKTTTLANLAVTYALQDHNVLMIDADFRKPKLHKLFFQTGQYGLSNLLQGELSINNMIQDTHITRCSLLAAGQIPQHPGELLASKRMIQLLKTLKESYDIILIDSPAVLAVTDAQILAPLCDGVLFVIRTNYAKKESVKKAKIKLQNVNACFMGAVFNQIEQSKEIGMYKNYYES